MQPNPSDSLGTGAQSQYYMITGETMHKHKIFEYPLIY